MMNLIAALLGLVIGALLGVFGAGGSILAVPALIYVLGMDLAQAIPTSLIVVGAGSAVAVVPKISARQVQWRLAGVFAAAGIPATFIGSAVSRHLPPSVVLLGFATVMVMAGVRMLLDKAETGTACKIGDSGINWRRCAPRSLPAGFAVGLLTGMFGVGGGFLIVPALVVLLGVQMPIAVGTSLLIIVANSAAGLIPHLQGTPVDWTSTGTFVAVTIVASLVAGKLGTNLDTRRLQKYFAYLVFVIAAYVAIDTLFIR